MEFQSSIVEAAEQYVIDFISQRVPEKYVFHDLSHTQEVVEAAYEIANGYELSPQELEILALAAWFHDTGYVEGPQQHEDRSCQIAANFLNEKQYEKTAIDRVCQCINATRMPQNPEDHLAQILADADMHHLGTKSYWDRCGRVRQEMQLTKGTVMSEQEWVDFEIDFMTNHRYHTEYASELYDKRKHKHIRQLIKRKLRLNPADHKGTDGKVESQLKAIKKKGSKDSKNSDLDLKELRLGRGVETMYRTSYKTHVSLSAIADNKANIMLSINAIIISIVVSTLVPQFDTNGKLVIPTLVLLVVCLTAMVFATLSTRPKVTEGKVSKEDIENRKGNLLFFGNFYKMELDDYDWGMKELIKDSDYLYSTMTKDLYFLGKVLAKKYRFLSYCYSVFLWGLIAAVIVFAVTFLQ